MGGEKVDMTEADGTYTIAKVTGDIVITVNKTTELTVEVSQYLELDGKTIFLVKVPGTLEEGKAYAYNGETMYYSNVYDAWSWLVIVEEGQTFTAEDALAKLAVVDAQFTTLDRNCDVNMTDKVDVNDAQLVYNMYNCHYDNFDVVSIEKFLYADTTGDGTVNTQDATAIVAAILAERNQG